MNPSNIKKIAEKNFQERRELNPVLLGEKQKCCLCQSKIVCPDFSDYRKGAENAKSSPEIIECGFNMKPGEGQICKVNAKDLMQSNCTTETKYGFEVGKPCILLKLNRVRASRLVGYTFH